MKLRGTTMALAVLSTLGVHAMVAAQTTETATPAPVSANAPAELVQQIVVTGTSGRKLQLDTPYAVSTINEATIQRNGPKSTVDLLKSLPGIRVENSGGQGGGENVVIRGLPFSGFRLMDLLEDGLPLFESNYERQLQIDQLYRVDMGTSRAEIVRGGTAPIYSNNASGGVVNFITNHGTETPEHAVKVSVGSGNMKRVDLLSSGPVNDQLLYSVSGFYRRDDGQRNPGYTADNGGQFKIGATYLLPQGQGKLFADFKYLNDRSIFYSAIPLVSPVTGASLGDLIDPGSGTLNSNSFRHATIRSLDGNGNATSVTRDLADGIHPNVKTLTIGGDINLANGWKLSDKARYTDGTMGFDALLNGSAADATTNLNGYLASAKAAFAGTTGVRYVYAGTNNVYNPSTTAGLTMTNTWQTTRIEMSNLLNDLRLSNTLDSAFGKHDVTLGTSFSRFNFKQQTLNSTLLTNVKDNADALDVQAINAAGAVTGNVTDNGFTGYGSGDLIGNVHGIAMSVYGAENWHINDDWQVDIGARHEVRQEKGNRGVIGAKTVSTTGAVAARTITGLTGYVPYTNYGRGTSWTIGSLYKISTPLNAFVRYSSAYSLPRLSDQWANINNGVAGTMPNGQPVPTVPIKQGEAGLKYATPKVQLALIAFWSTFKNLNSSTYVADASGNLTSQSLLIDTTTKGLEFEAAWRPVKSFELQGSMTVQQPKIDGATTFTTISANSVVGKLIPRAPRYMASVSPSYLFNVDGKRGRVYASLNANGKTYQDFVNTSELKAYRTVDVGVQFDVSKLVTLQLLVTNLTNSTGLTEGNARAPTGNTLTVADATVGRPIFERAITASATFNW